MQFVYHTIERLFMALIFNFAIAFLKSSFFLIFLNIFWLAGIYISMVPKRWPVISPQGNSVYLGAGVAGAVENSP